MKSGFISTLLMISFACMLTTPIVHADDSRNEAKHQDQIRVDDDVKSELMRQLGLAAQKNVGADAPASPLVTQDVITNVARQLPSKCIEHWQQDIDKLHKDQFTRDSWFGHVIGCRECCAPLMLEVIDAHVDMVASGPHEVLFFDFNDDTLTDYYKEKINSLFRKYFNKNQHRVLLVGRASKTGDPIYNERLSRKRAERVKQYLVDQGIVDEDMVTTMFFGYYPPQLTPDIAKKYGVEFQELQNITFGRNHDPTFGRNHDPTGKYRTNQSVVVIMYTPEDAVHETPHADDAARKVSGISSNQ